MNSQERGSAPTVGNAVGRVVRYARLVLRYLVDITGWLFLSALFGLTGGLLAAAYTGAITPLSNDYPFVLIVGGILGGALSVGILTYLLSASRGVPKSGSRRRQRLELRVWAREHPLRATVTAILVVAITGTMAGLWLSYTFGTSRLASQADEHFRISKVDSVPSFDEKALKVELERTRRRASEQWGVATQESIEVRIYPSRDTYLLLSPAGAHTQGVTECVGNITLIHVYPIHDARNTGLRVDPATARHETAHAVMCQALGSYLVRQFPDWLHEGYARSTEYDGWSHWISKSRNRLNVWLARSWIMPGERFCSFDTNEQDESADLGLFYATAWEFLRWLDTQDQPNFVLRVNNELKEGENVQQALSDVLGGSCDLVFNRWLATFSGGPTSPSRN